MPTPLSEPCEDPCGLRLGSIEIARVAGFGAMLVGVATGAALVVLGFQAGQLALSLGGVLLAAAASTFDLFGESALVRILAKRFERRRGSLLRATPSSYALVNVEPEATVARIKRVPDEIALLELVPRSGRLALEGVGGRAEIRAEHLPMVSARRDQLWPVVTLRYVEGDGRFDLVLYQQPSFVRFFAVLLGLLRVVRHPSERLAYRMRLALEGVQLPGRSVPDANAEASREKSSRVL